MSVLVKDNVFTLRTDNTAYQMKVGVFGHLLHAYYGKIIDEDMSYLIGYYDRGFTCVPNEAGHERTISPDVMPLEFSVFGCGDFRTPALRVVKSDGATGMDLRYDSYTIVSGKYAIDGLPAAYENDIDEGIETLIIKLLDVNRELEVYLYYGIFPKLDVITRAAKIVNQSGEKVNITKAASMSMDYLNCDYDVLHFTGRYGMERNLERASLMQGDITFVSRRGISSHQENPFFILSEKNTTEDYGQCYGFSLLYSGDFKNEIETDPYGQVRVCMGISDEDFSWELAAGSEFMTPEAVLSFSDCGLSKLSDNFHRLVRNNICRGKYKLSRRPVLINNWEATYFDFDGEKLVNIAKQASELGVELFVLDDGWFGKRESDTSGLGDWVVNEKKLQGPLKKVVSDIKSLGMKFGIWIEPEMISEDSDLYREHPDYAFAIPGRKPVLGRSQLVLDFSRTEVVDYIFNMIAKVLDENDIDYLKIDMNRSIHEAYSHGMSCQNRGALLHKYVLGMYSFLNKLNERYPDILIEGCCGGGGRFDMGMLYYVPQIWCSDNTDAIERLYIQHGTSFGYPMSTVGAHVSAVPNHQTGRKTPLRTRGCVAMCGGFGYELDLNLLSDDEKLEVKGQIERYKEDWQIIQQGSYYRLLDPNEKNAAAWMYVSEDKSRAIYNLVVTRVTFNSHMIYVKLKGLIEDAVYIIKETGDSFTGKTLMNGGLPVKNFMKEEYDSFCCHLERK